MTFELSLPRVIRFGRGVSRELPQLLKRFGLSRPLIVTDRFHHDAGNIDRLLSACGQGIQARVFADTVPEPTATSIEAGLAFLKAENHDCVIGYGGGSPIDSAKAIAVLAVHGGRCRDYQAPHLQDAPGLPIIAVPTTAGTGSEATRFTVITDEAADEKMLCAGLAYLPLAALVDPELTLTMPARLTADTGIDAMTHAMEAYVSRRASPFSDAVALNALAAIAPNIRRACSIPDDIEARDAMMLGSHLAGIAFSNASVALVHGMSRPIGAHFHVPHGLSNAMLLPAVTRFSIAAAPKRYADCARAMGVAGTDANDATACNLLLNELVQLNRDLSVPSPAEFGIERARWLELLPLMAEQALASGSPGNNPIIPTKNHIWNIYEETWRGVPEGWSKLLEAS
jgi:alcohol dehydrogenase class IV